MNFGFLDELLHLRDQARRFLTDRSPFALPRRILDTDEPHAAGLWCATVEMGLTGAAIAEEFGGVNLGRRAVCRLAEEIGRARGQVPFSASVYIATEASLLFGTEKQKQHWLPKLSSNETIGTVALTEHAEAFNPTELTAFIAERVLGLPQDPRADKGLSFRDIPTGASK